MPNEYFQFKQFKVEQDRCSMKVCTDSCVFGAWIAGKIEIKSPGIILDIGTGTGLLSLMIAQKSIAEIHSIDIDKNACDQAKENFKSAPWASRLHIFTGDVKKWVAPSKYGCIVANPPFYENDLLPSKAGKQNSKHGNTLTLNELIIAVQGLLAKDGFLGVMLPYSRAHYFENEANSHGLFVREKLQVRQSVRHDYFRTMLILEKNQTQAQHSEMSIRNKSNEYTNEFNQLLKDYYLNL